MALANAEWRRLQEQQQQLRHAARTHENTADALQATVQQLETRLDEAQLTLSTTQQQLQQEREQHATGSEPTAEAPPLSVAVDDLLESADAVASFAARERVFGAERVALLEGRIAQLQSDLDASEAARTRLGELLATQRRLSQRVMRAAAHGSDDAAHDSDAARAKRKRTPTLPRHLLALSQSLDAQLAKAHVSSTRRRALSLICGTQEAIDALPTLTCFEDVLVRGGARRSSATPRRKVATRLFATAAAAAASHSLSLSANRRTSFMSPTKASEARARK